VSAKDEPNEGGFLARWSRRKRESIAGQVEDSTAPADDDLGLASHAPSTADSPEAGTAEDPELAANRAAAEAIDIDSLTKDDDFTVFMRKGVPQALKNQALRKLWRTNPAFAVLDGLNDYDINFRTADKVLTTFQSAWEVGKGYAAKAEEMAARAAEEEAAKEAARAEQELVEGPNLPEGSQEVGAQDSGVDQASVEAAVLTPEPVAANEGAGPHNMDEGHDEQVAKVPIRRRMQVRFDS